MDKGVNGTSSRQRQRTCGASKNATSDKLSSLNCLSSLLSQEHLHAHSDLIWSSSFSIYVQDIRRSKQCHAVVLWGALRIFCIISKSDTVPFSPHNEQFWYNTFMVLTLEERMLLLGGCNSFGFLLPALLSWRSPICNSDMWALGETPPRPLQFTDWNISWTWTTFYIATVTG